MLQVKMILVMLQKLKYEPDTQCEGPEDVQAQKANRGKATTLPQLPPLSPLSQERRAQVLIPPSFLLDAHSLIFSFPCGEVALIHFLISSNAVAS